MSGAEESAPLLRAASFSGRPGELIMSSSASGDLNSPALDGNGAAGPGAEEDNEDTVDIAIEGMVLALVSELEERGYAVPSGTVLVKDEVEESEAELAAFRAVMNIPRHKAVLDRSLPPVEKDDPHARVLSPKQFMTSLRPGPAPQTATKAPGATTPDDGRPSPNSSTLFEAGSTPSPSALFLAALLSLLISLQADYTASKTRETDPGVDGDLRAFKARRELSERVYAVVESLLDSYLMFGDPTEGDDPGRDALVILMYQDFPLRFDSYERATCSLDLILNLASQPGSEAPRLISHPVVLATSEYVWRYGLVENERPSYMSWIENIWHIDRFSTPRILHSQTYLYATAHAAVTIYILLFSSYAHFDSFNPLAPDLGGPVHLPEQRPRKGFNFFSALIWYLWVLSSFGWAGEVGRAWNHRGPHPSLPLSPSTLLPLIQHSLVLLSLLLRCTLLLTKRAATVTLTTSLSLLAWSIPFLAVSRVLPQNLPLFGTPPHHRWEKIRDGKRRRDVGYRSPPKRVPESHRSLRALESELGGLIQFSKFFVVFGILLLFSLAGEIDYPGLLRVLNYPGELLLATVHNKDRMVLLAGGSVSPIEARTSLAFTLVLGVVLAYFAGGRPSVSGKVQQKGLGTRGLEDLDGWDRHGPEVAFRGRRERLAINRYFCYIPPLKRYPPYPVPSAFAAPPLPSPLNVLVPPLVLTAAVLRSTHRYELAQHIQQRGRLWIWRFGMTPLLIWALLAKGIRELRGLE